MWFARNIAGAIDTDMMPMACSQAMWESKLKWFRSTVIPLIIR